MRNSLLHILRDCPSMSNLWIVLPDCIPNNFFQSSSPDPDFARDFLQSTVLSISRLLVSIVYFDHLAELEKKKRLRVLQCQDGCSPPAKFGSMGSCIRDHKGQYILSFTKKLGIVIVLNDELWSISEGLHLAWDRGYRRVIIQSDNAECITIKLLSPPSANNPFSTVKPIASLYAQD
ncbi:uncharacterized protein LOC120152954 [Hibiscus syriacus]|uniref:uncharacterized protein LOC120152954 n=1 Tax=Hibiscus syriacus TaxID=106335 RepID=UPI001923226F|nr:uncharacterized protein LOC120152954 [Hibiscus syriacus]